MSWIGAPDGADPAVAAACERDRAAMGYVANHTRLLGHRPAVLDAWRGLNGAVKAAMDPRRYELATLAAALELRSSYCALAHGKVLADAEVLDAVGAEPDPAYRDLDDEMRRALTVGRPIQAPEASPAS